MLPHILTYDGKTLKSIDAADLDLDTEVDEASLPDDESR